MTRREALATIGIMVCAPIGAIANSDPNRLENVVLIGGHRHGERRSLPHWAVAFMAHPPNQAGYWIGEGKPKPISSTWAYRRTPRRLYGRTVFEWSEFHHRSPDRKIEHKSAQEIRVRWEQSYSGIYEPNYTRMGLKLPPVSGGEAPRLAQTNWYKDALDTLIGAIGAIEK